MADWSKTSDRGNNNNNRNHNNNNNINRDRHNRTGDVQQYRHFHNRNRDFRDSHCDVPNDPPFIAFVGNLPKGLVQGDVMKIFEDFEVKNVRLIKDRETDEFKGYGYVEFTTLDQLKRALSRNGRIKLDNLSAPLRIDIADHRRQSGSGGGPGGGAGGGGAGRSASGSSNNNNNNQRRNYRRDDSPGRSSTSSSFRPDRQEGSPRPSGYRGGRGGRGHRGGFGRARFNNDGNDGSNSSDYGSLGGNSLGSPRQNVEPHKSSTSFQSNRSFPHYSGGNYNNRYNNRNNNNNPNNNNNFRRGGGQRQRSISNDNGHYSNFGQNRTRDRRRHYNPNDIYPQSPPATSSASLDDEDRPKIVLQPRSVTEPINALAETKQSASIFAGAKPRINQQSPTPQNEDGQPGGSNQTEKPL
ncbi:probable serine/threonine-protein kinase clkA [Drosophila grimshawi]|uniref:GH14211 n=1 Tax=Drosophila grimshawi TaxID=7222 RepID=B4JY21_DROGR|nr:probable serine/threonine-protein kinase clkA [Drosophila grimshawi]EDV90583.1 GH14211 [Drosophila grimshawi]